MKLPVYQFPYENSCAPILYVVLAKTPYMASGYGTSGIFEWFSSWRGRGRGTLVQL